MAYINYRYFSGKLVMAKDGAQLCYLLILVASIGFLVWGFMDLLKKKQAGESDVQTISRQIRGFAFIMLAQVVLVVGTMVCFGLNGGMDQLGKAISSISK